MRAPLEHGAGAYRDPKVDLKGGVSKPIPAILGGWPELARFQQGLNGVE